MAILNRNVANAKTSKSRKKQTMSASWWLVTSILNQNAESSEGTLSNKLFSPNFEVILNDKSQVAKLKKRAKS